MMSVYLTACSSGKAIVTKNFLSAVGIVSLWSHQDLASMTLLLHAASA